MKLLISFFISLSIALAQSASGDTLVYKSGTKSAGEFIKVDRYKIHFKFEGQKNPVQVTRGNIKSIKILNTPFFDTNNGFDAIQKFKLEKIFAINCEKNKDIKVLFYDLSEDVYGISNELYSYYDSTCFNLIDKYKVLEFFESKNNDNFKINDYHLRSAGKEFDVDFVISGNAYVVNIPYRYSATSTDPVSIFYPEDDIASTIFSSLFVYSQQTERDKAIKMAGTYIYVTLYELNVKTGKKRFLMKNKPLLKIG